MHKAKPAIKLVIVLVQHPVLGALLMPYTAETESDETIRIVEQAFHISTEKAERLSHAEREAIKIASRYQEKHLMAIYSKEKNLNDFYKKLTEKKLKEIIRPFIEKKTREMVELICRNDLQLYQNQVGNKIVYAHSRYKVSPHITEVSFHFETKDDQFRYSLQCYRNGKEVSLLGKKPATVLTASPASILLGNELHLFRDISASRILPFTNKERISVDISQTDKYLEKVVLPVLRNHHISYSDLQIFEKGRECKSILSVEENIYDYTVLRLDFQYGDQVFHPGSPTTPKIAYIQKEEDGSSSIYFYRRDTEKEKSMVKLLNSTHLTLIDDKHFKLRKDAPQKDMSGWITANRELLSREFRLLTHHRNASYCLDEIHIEQDITESRDWFELHIVVVIGPFRIPFIHFRKNILAGKKEYLLPDGRVVLLPEEWFSKYTDLLEITERSDKDEDKLHVRKSFIGLVQPILEQKDDKLKISYQVKEEINPPKKLRATLRQYQKEGFNWMVHLNKHGLNGCLADDMGLGKTLQTLTLLQYVYDNEAKSQKTEENLVNENVWRDETIDKDGQLSLFGPETEALPSSRKQVRPDSSGTASLIVMPTSVLHNWRKEIRRFTGLTVFEYTGNTRSGEAALSRTFSRHHLVLTTYGLMRKHIHMLSKYFFEYIVLDESQNIKNSDSQTFAAAMQLRGRQKLILTGTPIENSLKDLWSQFHFLQPELLGNESSFQKQFILPVRQGDKRAENKLQQLIAPFILRRNKQEVAPELPSLTEEIIYCDMTEEQRGIYEKEKNSLRNILLQITTEQKSGNNLTILNGITRLRQLACHPQMIFDEFTGTSGKLEDILSIFETLRSEGHNVLIFSSFVKHLELIAEAFEKNNWSYALLTGSSTNREEEITRFINEKEVQAFLISLKAGGVGLNLTQADYVFIIDPWWNPAAEMQAIGRAHRIGQDKQVFAYRFIAKDSIEEKIIRLQEEKRKLSELFITDNNPLLTLTDKEWAGLLE